MVGATHLVTIGKLSIIKAPGATLLGNSRFNCGIATPDLNLVLLELGQARKKREALGCG